MRHSFALLTLAAALSAQADGPPYYDPDRSLNKQSEAASAAVEAIRKGAKAEEIAGYFAEKSAEVRDRAFEAVLERSDDQALLEQLAAYVGDKDGFVAAGVAEVFAAARFAPARKLLEKRGLTANDPLAQLEAVWALAAIGDPESAKPLERLYSKSRDFRVKGDALIAWAEVDPDGARQEATEALEHKLPPVQIAALVALQKIEGKAALRGAKLLLETELKGGARAWSGRLVFAALDTIEAWTNRKSDADLAKELVDALIARLEKAEGLPQHRIGQTLTNLTGQRIAANADMWRGWWQSQREGFVPQDSPVAEDEPQAKPPQAGDDEGDEAEGGGRKGPKTGDADATRVRFHGIPIYSKRLTFAQDVSGGMNNPLDSDDADSPSKMVFSKRELIRVLGQLDGDVMGNVVFFSTEYYRVADELLPLKRARDKLVEFVRAQQTPKKVGKQGSHKGRSNLYDTLAFCMQDPEIDTIFFLSEGGPNEGRFMRQTRFMRHLDKLNRYQRVQVHCLQVSNSKGGARFLKEISELTGGRYYDLDAIKAAHPKK
ncbi:MAG: HEAT repeat domain-containing protein [Planctomycetes bacterium]|nr:HEAT repeat domain-containing protein [Planctomycetota bacterium]